MGFFDHDQLQGQAKIFYKNGRLRMQTVYKEGIIHDSAWREFYDTGELYQTVAILEGKKQGEYKEYSLKGNVKVSGQYENDLKEGTFTFFDEKGIKVAQEFYKEGKLLKRLEFYASGAVSSEQNFFEAPAL